MILKILSNIAINNYSGCWNWTKAKNQKGYGHFKINDKSLKPHRIVFETFNGEIKKNYVIDHLCKNRICCNPDHLRQVTIKQNTLENSNSLQSINARKTHCIRGHIFDDSNTYLIHYKNGIKRQCKKCKKLYNKQQ